MKLSKKRRAAFERSLKVMDKKAVKVYRTFEEAEDATDRYWFSRTPLERLIALEHIRQLAWGYDEQSRPKLQGSPHLLKLRRRTLSGPGRVRR